MTAAIFVLLVALGLWWIFRFYPERRTVRQFLDTVVAGDFRKAHSMWRQSASYAYEDFLQDWGPNGEYGPVHSYKIESIAKPDGGSGVVVVVELSQYQPFPDASDAAKSRRNKEARIWIESKDLSMSYAP